MIVTFQKLPSDSRLFAYKDFMTGLLRINGIYLFDHNIEVSYNFAYHFFDVSIFKDCRDVAGNGTAETRESDWNIKLSILRTLFAGCSISNTYRVAKYDNCYKDKQDHEFIPGIRIFIKDGFTACTY